MRRTAQKRSGKRTPQTRIERIGLKNRRQPNADAWCDASACIPFGRGTTNSPPGSRPGCEARQGGFRWHRCKPRVEGNADLVAPQLRESRSGQKARVSDGPRLTLPNSRGGSCPSPDRRDGPKFVRAARKRHPFPSPATPARASAAEARDKARTLQRACCYSRALLISFRLRRKGAEGYNGPCNVSRVVRPPRGAVARGDLTVVSKRGAMAFPVGHAHVPCMGVEAFGSLRT